MIIHIQEILAHQTPLSPPNVHGYIAHKKTPPPKDPTVGPCLVSYGAPREWAFSYERGTPVHVDGGTVGPVRELARGFVLFVEPTHDTYIGIKHTHEPP